MRHRKILIALLLYFCCFTSQAFSLTKIDSVYVSLFDFLKIQNEIPDEYKKSCLETVRFMIGINELYSDTIKVDFSQPFALFEFYYKGNSGAKHYFLLKNKNEMIVFEHNDIDGVIRNLLKIHQQDSDILDDKMLIIYLNKIINKERLMLGTRIGKIWYVTHNSDVVK